jgi:hypothetical protein
VSSISMYSLSSSHGKRSKQCREASHFAKPIGSLTALELCADCSVAKCERAPKSNDVFAR